MTVDWWQAAAIYQVYIRSFQDTNGDGIGDLLGVQQRLDYLKDLGVDVLWLSPVHPSPNVDFGYDVADYTAVAPELGLMRDFNDLIAAAHSRGMRVLMDGVFNHSSDQHEWFRASCSEPDGDFGQFYIWRDGRGGTPGKPPNNYGSTFGGAAWRFVPERRQWCLHSFAPEQPDLNWRCPAVVEAVLDAMRHWLDRGIDGFRLDVFNCYLKDPALRNNPRRLHPAGWVYPFIGQHHVHDRDHPDLLPVLQRMRTLVDEYDAILIGETLDEQFVYDNAAQWVGGDRLHTAFHFRWLHSRWRAADFAVAINAWIDALGSDRWPTWVISNHDFVRAASRWGGRDDRVRIAAMMMVLLRGTPVLYQGDELGMRQARIPRSGIQDPPGQRFWPVYRGRDGARTPMRWSDDPHAGFTEGRPWLPIDERSATPSVAQQRADPNSVWSFWRDGLLLRRTDAVVSSGQQTPVEVIHGAVLRWERWLGDDRITVWINMSDRRQTLRVDTATWARVFGTHPAARLDGPQLVLRPTEGLALRMRSPKG